MLRGLAAGAGLGAPPAQQHGCACGQAQPRRPAHGSGAASPRHSCRHRTAAEPERDAAQPGPGSGDVQAAVPLLQVSTAAPGEAAGPSDRGHDAGGRKGLNPKVPKPGIRNSSLAGSVKNATARYDLPSPALAVRNLVEQAKVAHLCTLMSGMHHRRAGFPFGTLVDFASDGSGFPIFCLSPLAIHTRNILEDCRCSLVVELPGWTGLANARVTIFGEVYQLPPEHQVPAKEIFSRKQAAERKEGWVMGNFVFFRMHRISDIYFVGGFGTVQWVDVAEYAATQPDGIVLAEPHKTLQLLNERHGEGLARLLARGGQPADDAAFISIDRLGTDVRARHGPEYAIERLAFDFHVHTVDDALAATSQLLNHGIGPGTLQRRASATLG